VLTLRSYQTENITAIRDAMQSGHRRVLYRLPCGGGKTVIAAEIARRSNGVVFFCVHRRELLDQSYKTFLAAGIDCGLIAAEREYIANKRVYVCSIETLKRRLLSVPIPTLIIIDEAHHSASAGWARLIEYYNTSWFIGLTATPCRLDGKPLTLYNTIVEGPEEQHLLDNGYLCQPIVYAPPKIINLNGLKKIAGDYSPKELETRTNTRYVIGDAIGHYVRIASGRQCITYCPSVATAQAVADQYNAAGITAANISGDCPRRNSIIAAYRRRDIMVLTNVNIVTEGFDIPACEAIQMLRPTASYSLYVQMFMRGARTAKNKTDFFVLDHTGNYERHGDPFDGAEYSLSGTIKPKKKPKEKLPAQCPMCYRYSFGSICAICGSEMIKKRIVKPPEEIRAELEAVKKSESKQKHKEEHNAKTLDDFMAIARARGYNTKWAFIRYNLRNQRSSKSSKSIV